jgi:hypothetical protein
LRNNIIYGETRTIIPQYEKLSNNLF